MFIIFNLGSIMVHKGRISKGNINFLPCKVHWNNWSIWHLYIIMQHWKGAEWYAVRTSCQHSMTLTNMESSDFVQCTARNQNFTFHWNIAETLHKCDISATYLPTISSIMPAFHHLSVSWLIEGPPFNIIQRYLSQSNITITFHP